ncbi:hypothetical protein HII28_16145 [Planctomonas sp. JC2975]|uniref:hypothetical protein n=1 Tax=Planctomonas sp. JC2975 TaxID=2729626 RepID=UPI001473066B|nr:hypothetical protein [Planctomonas sp. JC2975]NNC13403.1 hypothetical protein [Planctomonas sp. JC2975]
MMSTNYGQMNAHELDVFASGYLEVIADLSGEMERMRTEITRLGRELEDARANAEAVYHQAFSAHAGRIAAAGTIKGIDIMRAKSSTSKHGSTPTHSRVRRAHQSAMRHRAVAQELVELCPQRDPYPRLAGEDRPREARDTSVTDLSILHSPAWLRGRIQP